ncbi:hypothetical protein TEA_011782 [Camellia sinensis var. sinensis]|uniref:WAT1-related protein n=1 Tax=Camellia sinensis var. sinensis TaxID=542762 RepID=A0A4V3WMM8_CAMSN|nr:hypothetical protein TEA_011782 [Camellia sinensis var. sinensis]
MSQIAKDYLDPLSKMRTTILANSGVPVGQTSGSSSTSSSSSNPQIDSQNPLQMCRHCEGLSRNFKKIMDKGKKVSEELDQLRDEEKQLRATIRTLTNQLKKLAPERTPTSLPSPEIKQLTSEEFDQLSARINDELVIIQQFLQDLSIARVDCPGLAYQWTYTYEDEEQPCLDEERCNKRSELFGRCQCNLDFSICLSQINLATFEPLEIEIRGETRYLTSPKLLDYGFVSRLIFTDPDQTDNFGHKLAHAVLCVMEEHHPYVEALIDSKLPEWKEIWCNPAKHKMYLRGTSTFPGYPGLLNRRHWPCRRFSLKDQLNKWRKFARNSLLAYNGNYGHLVCEDRHQKIHCNLAIPRYPFSKETFIDKSQYPNYQHGVSHESPVMGEYDQEWDDEPPMGDGDDFYDQLSAADLDDLANRMITIAQNLAFVGLSYSSPILACGMGNLIPTFSFLISIILRVQKWCMEVKGPFYVPLFKPLGIPIATFCGCFFFADSFHYGSILGLAIVGMGYYTVMWGQIRADETHIDRHHHDGTMDSSEDKVPLLEGDSQV